MFDDLKIILYPDPRLRKVSKPVQDFGPDLAALATKMLELMRSAKGVGLAAPQVGKNMRLFVMNHSGEPGDDRVYVNPALTDPEGDESSEEGCLSIPDVKAEIARSVSLRITAQDLMGRPFEQTETGYIARVWQHEFDHLNGTLLIDRMGTLAKMTHRRKLKDMEEKWAEDHPAAQKTAPTHAKKKRK